jgi:D-alanyl-D-alanine carboxypeptidase
MTARPVIRLIATGVLLAAAAWPQTANASPAGASPVSLQRALDRIVATGPPGAVLLVRGRDRTLRLTSGHADQAGTIPMRARNRFRVASLTKSFVATVVLQLVGEGRLALDDSVERWLPGAVPGGERITIRQLLDHTSGVFDYFNDPRLMAPYEQGRLDHRYTPRELLAFGTSHPPLFAPGTTFAYSNTGYVLLGLIVEARTGNTLRAELERRIFTPLRLRATTFGNGAGRRAHGYARLGGRLRDVARLNLSFEWAAGAIVSSAGDVARFYRALLDGRLVRPDLVRTMTTPALGAGVGYGAGLEKLQSPCGPAWGHSGATPGFTSHAYSSVDGKRQIVVLYNLDHEALPSRTLRADRRLMISAYCG